MEHYLNLGCGDDIRKSTSGIKWTNVDVVNLPGVDKVFNFEKFPWPFKDNTFDLVYTSHVLEHMENLPQVMQEIQRISKPESLVRIRVPHFSCGVTFRDPTHKRFFSYFTFDYFTDQCFYNLPKFRIIDRKLNFTRLTATSLNLIFNPVINLSPAIYERFFCWILPCSEILCTLQVRKP